MTLRPLILKSLAFSGLLILVNWKGGIFWFLVFIIASFYFYFRSPFKWKDFFFSFLILFSYSLAITDYLKSGSLIIPASAVFGTLFFLLLGVKNFAFIHRQNIFNVLSGFLYFMVSVAFFIVDKSKSLSFLFYYLITFFAFYFILKESFDFLPANFPKSRKSLIVIGTTFLIAELLIGVALLPIGFLNSAALMLLFVFILEDFISYYLKGGLNRRIILNNITILIAAVIFIFATSKWTP